MEDRWEELTRRAVAIARGAVPEGHRVAGSISPLEDCYRPDLSPPLATCRAEHARTARTLVESGVDLLLCETFPHVGEGLAALDAALEHDVPVWLSLTPGPEGDLLSRAEVVAALTEAARRGADAVLVNCAPVSWVEPLLFELAELPVALGAYGNVGRPCADQGWRNDAGADPQSYVDAARSWLAAGASIIGGCCGTSVAHISALSRLAETRPNALELGE